MLITYLVELDTQEDNPIADVSGILAAGQGVPSPMAVAQGASTLNNSVLTGQGIAISNQQKQQDLSQQRTNRLSQLLAPALSASDQELDGGQLVHNIVDQATQSGDITANEATHWKQSHPLGQPAAAYRPGLTRALISTLAGPEALGALTPPPPQLVDVGGQKVPVSIGSAASRLVSGQTQPLRVNGQAIPGLSNTMTPGDANSLLPITDPNTGRTAQLTKQDAAAWAAAGYPSQPDGTPNIPGGGSSRPPTGGGPSPYPPMGPGAHGAGLLPQVSTNRFGPTDADIQIAKQSSEKQQADVSNFSSPTWQQNQQAINSVINLGPSSKTGKGTDWLGNAKAVVTNLAPSVAQTLGIDINNVNDRAELAKSMARVSLTAGNRSDAELFHQVESNPNMTMPPGAVQNVARYIAGLNNQERALSLEASQKATNGPKDLNSHYGPVKTALSQTVDLHGFTPLSVDQFDAYIKSLPAKGTPAGDAARAKLKASQALAAKYNQPNTGALPEGQPQ